MKRQQWLSDGKRAVFRCYRTATPRSPKWVCVTIIAIIVIHTSALFFTMGTLAGASAALHDETPPIEELKQADGEAWSLYADEGPISRSAYGLFHWITVLITWSGVVGLYLGHSLPWLVRPFIWIGAPVNLLEMATIVSGSTFTLLQFIRIIDGVFGFGWHHAAPNVEADGDGCDKA